MVYVWVMYAPCMVYVCRMYGQCMDHVWMMYGLGIGDWPQTIQKNSPFRDNYEVGKL